MGGRWHIDYAHTKQACLIYLKAKAKALLHTLAKQSLKSLKSLNDKAYGAIANSTNAANLRRCLNTVRTEEI